MRQNYDKNMDGEFENRISENVPVTTISPFGGAIAGKVPNISYSVQIGHYLAMDRDQCWNTFCLLPNQSKNGWEGNTISYSRDSTTKAWPDWKDSLFLMTENGLEKV